MPTRGTSGPGGGSYTRSCAQSKEMIKLEDGRELPLIKLETTSETHPFYTGTQKSIDNLGGRVEKFRNKFAHVGLKKPSAAPAAAPATTSDDSTAA